MHRPAAALALALLAALPGGADAPPPGARQPVQRRLARDTEQHVAAGVAASMAAAGLFTIMAPRSSDGVAVAATVGVATALAAGFTKEVADRLGMGTPELRDLAATAAGGLVGAAVALLALAGADATAGGPSGMGGALLEGAALTAAVVVARVALPPRSGGEATGTAAPPQ